jgi:hypothetical protein
MKEYIIIVGKILAFHDFVIGIGSTLLKNVSSTKQKRQFEKN